jgi:hypothetical protein
MPKRGQNYGGPSLLLANPRLYFLLPNRIRGGEHLSYVWRHLRVISGRTWHESGKTISWKTILALRSDNGVKLQVLRRFTWFRVLKS